MHLEMNLQSGRRLLRLCNRCHVCFDVRQGVPDLGVPDFGVCWGGPNPLM